ncbi:hypothetical protein D3C86_1927830 [compost metagenome]
MPGPPPVVINIISIFCSMLVPDRITQVPIILRSMGMMMYRLIFRLLAPSIRADSYRLSGIAAISARIRIVTTAA